MRAIPRASTRLLLLVVISFALSACDGDNGGDGGNKEQIVDAITEGSTSSDPEKCTAFNTQDALEQATGLKGEAAIKACEQFAGFGNAESVEVSNISVAGDTATAEAAVTGSEADGQTLALKLVKENGQWKMDRLTGFVSFDREPWNAAIVETFSELQFPPAIVNCVRSRAERLSDDDVQNIYVRDPKGIDAVIDTCVEAAK